MMATVNWPFTDAFKPQFNGYELSSPSLVRRTDFEDGEDRVRRTGHHKPSTFRAEFDILRAEMGVFRRWLSDDIDHGRLWFNMPAFIDDTYQIIEARLIADGDKMYTARLIDDINWRVSLSLEIRELPQISDAIYLPHAADRDLFYETVPLSDLLDQAINVDLKGAAS